MSSSNQLDLSKTVETTLSRAKEWLLASYPSKNTDAKIRIDVNYPQNDITAEPESVSIFRGNTHITLGKTALYGFNSKKQNMYSMTIHTASGYNYAIRETADFGINESGEKRLLTLLQRDNELSQFITFVLKNDPEPITSQQPKWNLDKLMEHSRN